MYIISPTQFDIFKTKRVNYTSIIKHGEEKFYFKHYTDIKIMYALKHIHIILFIKRLKTLLT